MNPNVAVDAPLENRPGVPRENRPPEPLNAQPSTTEGGQQIEVLVDPSRAERTPVFSSNVPPHGISGVLRRVAYLIPDYRVRRWLLLLVADRVDALEQRLHRAGRARLVAALVGFVGLGAGLRLVHGFARPTRARVLQVSLRARPRLGYGIALIPRRRG